jgi:hypothetical protein
VRELWSVDVIALAEFYEVRHGLAADLAQGRRMSRPAVAGVLSAISGLLHTLPPRTRFARPLLRLAPYEGLILATRQELGNLAGMSGQPFDAFLGLSEAGVVKTEYGRIRIVDRAALEAGASRR